MFRYTGQPYHKSFAFFVATVFGFLVVLHSPSHAQASDTISVDIANNGDRVEMVLGQILELHLEEAATGYRWDIVSKNGTILSPRDSSFVADGHQAPGSPVTKVWRFEAVGTGEMELKLVFHRPWQQNVDPEDEFKLHITVL